jgi:hypothetical protein
MEPIELSLSVASAGVLVMASTLKLLARRSFGDWLVSSAEVLVAAAIVPEVSRPFALAAGCGLGLVFAGYSALRADRPCRCFGDQFRVASRSMRIARALAVSVLCGGGLIALRLSQSDVDHRPATAIVVGSVVALAVMVLPALLSPAAERPRHVSSYGHV